MKTSKKKWLYRALCAAMAVALVSGTAVMTPIADIVGTNITAHATENIVAQGSYWKLTDDDKDGNYKLTIFGTIPDTNENSSNIPWYSYRVNITEVTTEDGAKTSADASCLFIYLMNATSIDLSHLDTSAATNMNRMFYNCQKLTSLNLSGFDTSDVTNMNGMFYYCQQLTSLDLSSWDVSNVTNMGIMFYNCQNLKTIYVSNSWNTDKVDVSGSMFYGCALLAGGQGTTYNADIIDKTYAKVDGGTDNPGYLTGKYTVTWKNDNDTILETGKFVNGTAPVYDGETPAKASADGKKYAFAGWTDGTNTYTPNSLPNATGDVTYTAVFEEYDKDIAQNVGYYVGDKINFGDTYIKDYIWQNANTYHISGVYTLVSAVYDSDNHYYKATLQSRNETIQLITDGYSDMGEQIAFVCTSGQGTERYPYQFQMKKYGTVIWKDEDGNVVETDEKVLNDARPSYDGEALTKESEEPDKYHYVLRWSKDNTNDPYEYDQLFAVSFYDTDTVTYNAVFLKAQYVAENGVYSTGDTIDFNGKYVKMEDSGGVGVVNSIKTIQNIRLYNASTGRYQVALHQSRSTGYFYFTVGENYGSKVAYVVKSGTGTQDDPYIMGIAPYFTVTWKNGEDIIETDEKVIEGDTPTYDGETPTKDSTAQYNYTFAGWTSDGGTTVYTAETLPAVTQNVTYTAVFDAELITYPFSIDKSAGGVTFEIADHESNPVAIDNKSFSAPIGSKITSSAELVFDGAEVTAETSENSYVYTIKSVSKDSVTVSRKKVAVTELTVTADNQTYTGNALTPVIVKDGETVLTENTDYTVVYTDNVNAGTATAKITGADTYITGETTVNFTIAKKNIASLAVSFDLDGDGTEYAPETYTADSSKPSIIYDGKEYTPTAKLLFSNEEVPTDSYDVSITSAQNADTYTITFTAKENTNFTGTRTFDWNITKADMNITMTDGLEFNRVGGKVAGECVDESKFAVTGAPDGSTTTLIYFSEQGLQLPKVPTEAGNYTVKAVVTNDNYNDGEATATFTIISNQAGDWYFLKNGNSMLITGYAGDSTTPTIPETINGLPVTGIYYYAFEDSDITSVTIPESVDMIYSYAFKNAKKLTDVYYKGSKTEWKKEVTISNGNNLLKNATIHYALPENIYLDQTTLETTVGKSVRLLVSVSPVGTPADFTWESSDEKVATVDENGNVTTLDFGTATITATADNGKTAVCELTVGHNGSNGIFEYTVSDDKEVTLTKYIGTSDTVEVADKIDDMPIVAIAEGTFAETPVKTINYTGSKTMWEELFTGELAEDITVNYALPTSISLDATAEVTKADTITLTPTVTPADTATTFTWTSDDETIATVDENGVVTGVAYGTVDITATADNGQTATCAVTVTNIGEKDDFEYEIVTTDDEDTITITKYNGSDEEVNIPETINGISVTAIGAEAFKDNETMKDVIILLNVETIGDDAFAGCNDELNIHGYRRTDSERYATENNVNFVAIPYPLENASTISSDHADVNEQIKVTGVGVEGTLSYKYAVYYKSTDSDTWTARQSYNKNNVVTLAFTKDGTYDICMKVKDTAGSVEKKYFVLTVTQPLTNTSTISANVITLGETFTVNMSAQDGSGTYEYAVEMKPISETEWTTVSDYSADESVTITPDKAGVQNVCVNVKDGFGTIKKKYFVVDVKYTAPSNISTISGDTIKVGESVTVNCAAENGSGTFKYGVYTKSVQSAKWTTVQNFDENAEVTATFDKPGIYQVCAKAMDTDGTIVKKYFAVEVTKDALFNKSTISASEIMAGESIDVNAVAEGGFGAYKYAVYYKLSESSKWTTVQQFDANGNVTITPTKAGRYEICVKVKDETGEIVKKYFMAEVKYEPLVNKCTLSAEEVNFGETLTVTANAENGSGEYKYAVYIKSTERTAWNTVQDFSEQTEINVTFKNKGAYDICIKVMDSYGTVSKTYTSVYVK